MLNAERLRPKDPSSSLASGQSIGQVVSVRGSKASVGLVAPLQRDGVRATVGKFLGICAGPTLLVGVITNVLVSEAAGPRRSARGIPQQTSTSSVRSSNRPPRRNFSAASPIILPSG